MKAPLPLLRDPRTFPRTNITTRHRVLVNYPTSIITFVELNRKSLSFSCQSDDVPDSRTCQFCRSRSLDLWGNVGEETKSVCKLMQGSERRCHSMILTVCLLPAVHRHRLHVLQLVFNAIKIIRSEK